MAPPAYSSCLFSSSIWISLISVSGTYIPVQFGNPLFVFGSVAIDSLHLLGLYFGLVNRPETVMNCFTTHVPNVNENNGRKLRRELFSSWGRLPWSQLCFSTQTKTYIPPPKLAYE